MEVDRIMRQIERLPEMKKREIYSRLEKLLAKDPDEEKEEGMEYPDTDTGESIIR